MLSRWDPFAELSRLQDELFRNNGAGAQARFAPAVDIWEDNEAIHLHADMAGVKPDDLRVSVENNVLTLSGERKLQREDKKNGYHRIERSYGAFTRSFALPKGVQEDQVKAEIKDGVLTLVIPKAPAAQRREVKVRAS
jgi:HSP20 family protein